MGVSARRTILLAAFLAACATDGSGPGGPGPATGLLFSAQPNAVMAGEPITPAIQVTARDAQGNTVVAFTGTVAVALGNNPGGATLTGTLAVAAVAGVATFTDLSLNRSGPGYTLVATSGSLAAATSASVTVSAAAATELAVTGLPANTPAGAAMTPAVQVSARDAFGNTATSFTGGVTVAIGANPSGGALTGTTARPAVAGVATFSDLTIDKSGAGYTLTASASGLAPDTSNTFTISAGSVSPTQSTVSASPAGITASNGSITSTITVLAKDAFGNLIQGATVTLAATGSGNTVTQPGSTTNASGVATGTLSSTVAEVKTVTATVNTVGVAQSASITIAPAAASALVFAVSPSSSGAGNTITPPIQVVARDAFGNTATAFAGNVTMGLGANPSGATISGTNPVTAVSGVAVFANLSLDKVGAGYTMVALASGLSNGLSTPFDITSGGVSAARSTMSAAPQAITASTGVTTSTITVRAFDAFDNPIQGATVVLSATGTGNTLTQPSGTTNGSGVATGTFSSTAAEAKVISATIGGVTITQTAAVTVNPAVAVSLAFTVQPTNGVAGATITPVIAVTANDQFGNIATGFSGSVTVGMGTNPGGGTLSGTPTRTAAAGVATFNNLSIDKTGSGYTLNATATGLSGSVSDAFNITAAGVSAAQSTVNAAPPTITASTGASSSTITVTAKDAFGNAIAGATVVLSASGAGNTVTQPAATTGANGVAAGSLSSTGAGLKSVTATVNGVVLAQQPTVTVNAASFSASQSTVSGLPAAIEASNGANASTITVTAKDGFGNPIQGVTVVLLATGSGNTLTQPSGATNTSGVATGTLSSTATGTKVVSATGNGSTITDQDTILVVPGEISAAQSTLQASPASIPASNGSSISTITVIARDDQGNLVPGASVVLSATGSGNTLTQPAGATDVNGVATGTLRSTVVGAKVVSGAIDGTGIAQTDTVTVIPSVADRLAFIVQPASATVGNTITPSVQVEIRDQFGNRVTGAGNPITLGIGTNPSGGTLTGGGPVAAINGVATFANLSIDQVGAGYRLTAAATGLTGATSNSFNISAGVVSASQSGVDVSPGSIVAGSATSTITVTARDAGGNPVSGATVVLSAAGGGTTITQPGSPTDGSGVATGTLSSTTVGMKTVSATANGVGIAQQRTVTVTAGPVSASQSTLGASPASIVAGAGTSTITVTAKDGFGNVVSGVAVVLFATGSGNNLTQPSVPTNGSGVATGTLASANAGSKVVSATADGVAVTQTATVTVTAPGSSVVMVGAGDIAVCGKSDDEATAALVNAIPGEVFALGDNVYEDGTTAEFNNCYNPSWGAFKSRTHPAAGNHEYNTSGALPYYAYFGAAAGAVGQGYYSYDVGAWHVIVLNSNISTAAGSAQVQWLESDLSANQNFCTMAYWHHPLYSSIGGTSGTTGATISSLRPLWDALYAAGADLVLTGHRHVYERLRAMRPDGTPDDATGIRSFVVGTGGNSGGDLTNIFPTSEEREGRTYGVMKLTLHAGSYDWQFIPVAGETYTDSGTGACH
jgi:hypothetical protein